MRQGQQARKAHSHPGPAPPALACRQPTLTADELPRLELNLQRALALATLHFKRTNDTPMLAIFGLMVFKPM